jgi:hypothetical protein
MYVDNSFDSSSAWKNNLRPLSIHLVPHIPTASYPIISYPSVLRRHSRPRHGTAIQLNRPTGQLPNAVQTQPTQPVFDSSSHGSHQRRVATRSS